MTTTLRTFVRGLALLLAAASPPAARAAAPPDFHLPQPVVRTLPNGLRVAVFTQPRLPIVQMSLVVPAGSAQEAPETPGVAQLAAQLLRAGTTTRTAAAFAADVDQLGGTISSSAARDYSSVSGSFLAADFEAGLELLADAVVNPLFPPEEVDRGRMQSAGLLMQTQRDAQALADERLWASAFEGHPYGRPPLGTLEALGRMDRDAVQAFHRDFYRPDRALLAIAGDVDPERAFAAAADRFGSWAGRAASVPAPGRPGPAATTRIRIVDRPGEASEVRIGFICPPRSDPDALPLQLANYVLGGGGLSSRLMQALRVNDRLSYDVRGNTTILRDAGLVSLGSTARSDSVAILIARMRDELDRLRSQPPTEPEVAAARRYFASSYSLQFQTLGALILQWTGADLYGLPAGWLDRYPASVAEVTSAQVAAAAARWLDPAHMVVVVVGPAAQLRDRLAPLGPVEIVGGPAAPAAAPTATGPAPASPEQVRRGRELLGRALAAHGGLDRLRRVKDSIVDGDLVLRMSGSELQVRMLQTRKDPMRMRYSTRMGEMENGQVLNGDRGWLYVNLGDSLQVMDADSTGMEAMRAAFRSDIVHTLLAAADPAAGLAWGGAGRADGHDAERLDVTLPARAGAPGERRTLWFDAKEHHLIAEEVADPRGRAPSFRKVYRDFRPVDGVLWPFYEERMLAGTKTMTLALREVRINTGVLDGLFRRPVLRAADQPLR
jgi:zinc protease